MESITVYHGSTGIVTPVFGEGKNYNDYGQGFYCTENLELAKEWACSQDSDGYANQIEKGNPRYVAGLSGVELACHVVEISVGESPAAIDGTFTISPEYWAGWVLTYYQWKSGKSFRYIHDNGLQIEKVIALYHPLHEADLDKFATVADRIIAETVSKSMSPLKKAREQHGLTQEELSRLSGVSLRMIRAYEQKSQDITKANFRTVSRLESVLHADFSDI